MIKSLWLEGLVYKLKHDFENLDFWGKDDFFFFSKMDEAWPNAPNLEMDAWSLEILIFFFFFFENEWGMAECP